VVSYADVISKLGLQTREISKTIDVLTDPIHSKVKGNLNKIEKTIPKLPLMKSYSLRDHCQQKFY
jgi:hypothetical protein